MQYLQSLYSGFYQVSETDNVFSSVCSDVFSGVQAAVQGVIGLPGRVSELYQKVILASSPAGMTELIAANEQWLFEQINPRNEVPGLPFIDKQYKNFTVLSESAKRVGLYALGMILSYSNKEIAKETLELYQNLSIYQRYRAVYPFQTWCLFGEEVVDFSSNVLPAFTENLSVEELEELYGRENWLKWMNLSTDKMYIDKQNVQDVARRDMFEGRCFGISFDFIALYLEKKKTHPELSTFDIVKQLAPIFRKGASDRAELAQICSLLSERKPPESSEESSWTTPEPSYEEWIVSLIKDMGDLLAKGFGFTLGRSLLCSGKPKSESLESLDPGVYSLMIRFEDTSRHGHAIFVIKTEEEKEYIFDPNYGTLAVDKENFGTRLEEILSLYEKPSDQISIVIFNRCS